MKIDVEAGRSIAGTFFWSATGPSFSDKDAFSVCLHNRAAYSSNTEESLLGLFKTWNRLDTAEGFGTSHTRETTAAVGDLGIPLDGLEDCADSLTLEVIREHAAQMKAVGSALTAECPLM